MDAALILMRLMQYLTVSAVGGASLFFVFGLPAEAQGNWPRTLVRLAAGLGVLGVTGWLMAQAGELGDSPYDALKFQAVWSVARDTGFGRAALVRAALLATALGLSFLARPSRAAWTALAALGLAAAAGFAWTGHGVSDEGAAGAAHLAADVLHLLSAVIWVGALLGLSGLLIGLGRRPDCAGAVVAVEALDSFSRIGVAVVAIVAATGLVNSWFLVGPAAVPSMLTTLYGRLLATKLVLFAVMLGFAAANRYRHTARLKASRANSAPTALHSALRSVLAETLLAAAVLAIVSWLGTLPPPAHG